MAAPGKSHQFHTRIKQHWERSQMVDARKLATSMGAVPVRPFRSHSFENVPGDMPATLWRWPDGSEFVIMDSGNSCHAARTKGRGYNEAPESVVPEKELMG